MIKTNDQSYQFSFTETESYEKGFTKVFHSKLIPVLQRMKAKRERDRIISSLSIGLAVIIFCVFGILDFDDEMFMLGILTVVILVLKAQSGFHPSPKKKSSILDWFLYILSYGTVAAFAIFHINDDIYILFWVIAFFTFLIRKPKQNSINEITPIIGQFLGYTPSQGDGIDIEQAAETGLLHFDSVVAQNNRMMGKHNGLSFETSEAELGRVQFSSGGDSMDVKTNFKGLLIQITTKINAPQIHFVPRGRLKFILKHYLTSYVDMEQIEFGESDFNDLYAVYTDQPETARAFIDEHLIEGLIWLSRDSVRQGRVTGCAMMGDKLFLTIQRNNDFLSLGAPLKETRNMERDLHLSFGDLSLPGRVIDALCTRSISH